MTTKAKHGLIAVSVVLIIAGTVFFIEHKKKNALTNNQKINAIILSPASGMNASNYPVMQTFGVDYINAWYNAIQAGAATFVLLGKTYRTAGGEAV